MRDVTVIENERVEKHKELKGVMTNHYTIKQERLLIQREIIKLQGKKKDLEIAEHKALHEEKMKRIESEDLKNEFWSSKNV